MVIKKKRGVFGCNKGFTLVEIAIVLIIIGLILGAVVKGKNLIRSAEQKKVYTKFLNEWRTSYLTFYDRTGSILGDFWSAADSATGQDGNADTSKDGSEPNDTGRNALIVQGSGSGDFLSLEDVGIEPPVSNIPNQTGWAYKYTDSDGGSHQISVAFDNDSTGRYNYMRIENIPNELAIAMDTLVDNVANGKDGQFIGDAQNGSAWGQGGPTKEITVRWKMEF